MRFKDSIKPGDWYTSVQIHASVQYQIIIDLRGRLALFFTPFTLPCYSI